MVIPFNKTKVIATVGPASNSYDVLKSLILAGTDVFRLNFSHGTHQDHLQVIKLIRQLNEELDTSISIMQDLQGPKIRLGDVENGSVMLESGEQIRLLCDNSVSNAEQLATNYETLAKDVEVGDMILIDDGKLELKVTGTDKVCEIQAEVVFGGVVKPRKGINLPDTNVSIPSLTEKDLLDLEFGLENDVDWVALSFVRKVEDILHIKEIIKSRGKDTKVIAKIEKPEAIKNIDGIVEEADALMVARGDLGVEMPMEEVPMLQKMLVQKCNIAAKPVIIATQMMESMIQNPRPTRAETNDVANAVMDGADALMLSAETATGAFPEQVIKSMNRTITSIETHGDIFHKNFEVSKSSPTFCNDILVGHACNLARDTEAKAIIGMTKSGYTAFQLAKHRPKAHIFIFTSNKNLLNKLNLVWGVRGFHYDKFESTDATITDIKQILVREGHLKQGDIFVNTASMPINEHKRANMIKVSLV
ncbi:MAG: pyruvate kinase [Hymenobacteraceae bacterium]|nr:pyruvate kinase [Hymenobacteraceae bacterium]MDX5395587.1 pyruvate kinase [Hymenobacteraceae bacterium]MDX5443180.1 pyruvate kinase [Hymenobacteraceae bacterium]MDX5511639.1 pyruvate kinase [Hymenobacteraceae bacterium]